MAEGERKTSWNSLRIPAYACLVRRRDIVTKQNLINAGYFDFKVKVMRDHVCFTCVRNVHMFTNASTKDAWAKNLLKSTINSIVAKDSNDIYQLSD